jgi:hypothetical protein
MGVMGSLVAHQLAERGIPFTWHDSEEKRNAWEACTGVIYPSGVKLDNDNYKRWLPQCSQSGVILSPYRRIMERATYCFFSKNAPHNGRAKVVAKVGGVNVSDTYSLHLNAQRLVMEAWFQFLSDRMDRAPHGKLCIVTHGFHPDRIGAWSWGWSKRVELNIHHWVQELCLPGTRPCFYMRDGHVLDYAYPVPGLHNKWYAGTTLVTQANPKSLLIAPKYGGWKARMMSKAQGAFTIRTDTAEPVEGWRPIPHPDTPLVERVEDTIYLRAQYGSGIRHFWTLWDALEKLL